MSAEAWSTALTVVFFIASAAVVLIFIVLYAVLAKWEKSELGRHIMSFAVATFAVLLQGIIGFTHPGYPGQLVIRPLVYLFFLIVWVWRVIIFLNEQRDARKEG